MNHRKYALRFALIIIVTWAFVWGTAHHFTPAGA